MTQHESEEPVAEPSSAEPDAQQGLSELGQRVRDALEDMDSLGFLRTAIAASDG